MGYLQVLVLGLHKCDPTNELDLLPTELMTKIIGQVAKQCVEKIDNVRVHAGNVLMELLHYRYVFRTVLKVSCHKQRQ